MTNIITEIRPIFVVGSPRSGTTVVTKALELSEAYFCPHLEAHLSPWLLEGVQRVWEDPNYYVQAFLPSSICTGNNFEVLLQCLGTAIDQFMRKVSKGHASEAADWIDKTPDLKQIQRLPLIQKIFPKSRIVFTTRHPRDVAISTKFVWNPPISDRAILLRWHRLHKDYRTKIRPMLNLERVMEIHQEGIVSQSEEIGLSLAKFLKLSTQEGKAFAGFFKEKRINRLKEFRDGRFDYLEFSNTKFLKMVDLVCGYEMSYLGYDSAFQKGPGNFKYDKILPNEPMHIRAQRKVLEFPGERWAGVEKKMLELIFPRKRELKDKNRKSSEKRKKNG